MTKHIFLLLSSLLLSLQFCTVFCASNSLEKMGEPIVQVQQGKLKGRVAEDYKGQNYFSFQGIPYAKPPLGELRFKAPVPAEPWTGILDATKEGRPCVQWDPLNLTQGGGEDCLFLNVYTKELISNGPLKPVMVWIHGGGFTSGSSKTNLYGPEFLITEDVVVVSINYRVALAGFLSFEDTSLGVPGNAGLKDMVLALNWVKQNIHHFNGDKNNVTIFGESAGGAACHYLIMSESAKGLFHRAILQSGVCINQWAMGPKNGLQIAKALGSTAKTEAEALEFLKGVPAEAFIKAHEVMIDDLGVDHSRNFVPVIENPNPEAFLTEHPIDLMLAGKYNKVPIIMGYNNREGMLMDLYTKVTKMPTVYRMKDFEKGVPSYLDVKPGTELSRTIAKKIEDFYFGVSKDPEEDVDKFYIMGSDTYFVRGIHVTLRALLKTSDQPIYFYRFNYETSLNVLKNLAQITKPGVCHGDDIGYVFKGAFTPKIEPGSQEDIAIRTMVKLWTNFAKTGNPTPEKDSLTQITWPQVTSNNFQCLEINQTFSIATNPEQERMKFWDEIAALEGVNSKY